MPLKRLSFLYPFRYSLRNMRNLDWLIFPSASLLLILATHYGVFLGHTFFVGELPFIIYNYNIGNLQSAGWRPDLGLGISWMLGDPGTFHPWSLFRWNLGISIFPTVDGQKRESYGRYLFGLEVGRQLRSPGPLVLGKRHS